jgi:hypothetical protein
LASKQGTVERDWATKVDAWKAAAVGTEFRLGDGVQTASGSDAVLTLDDGSQLSLQQETRIRFSDQPPPDETVAFDVETGSASLQAGTRALSIQTSVGLAQVESGAVVLMTRGRDGLKFVVQVGQAVFGDSGPLHAGDQVGVSADGKVVKRADKADGPPPIAQATLEPEPVSRDVTAKVTGKGASVRQGDAWVPLAEGTADLAPRTELKLAQKARVELERAGQRAVLHDEGSYVVAPRSGVLVGASSGSFSAGSLQEVRVEVPGGVIVVAPDGLARLNTSRKQTRVEVQSRRVVIETADRKESVAAGQSATVAPDGVVDVEGRGLDYADVEIDAGDSVVVHDPRPPTAVRFLFGDSCSETTGRINLKRQGRARSHAAGERAVTLSLQAGIFRYELTCGQSTKAVREGRITVLRDRGTRAITASAPSTDVQADGRTYTVLYQNRLPGVNLTWQGGPTSSDLELVHESSRGNETLPVPKPLYSFEPGNLEEGRHVFYFKGDGKLSRRTTVVIAFDNAAPTATLNTPTKMEARPGELVTISGTALPGWDVEVEGQRPQKDRQGRFSMPTALPLERRAVAVRLSHPRRGTHLYLRRGTL